MSQLNVASGSGITFDTIKYPVINIKYSVKVDNTDTTDSDTAVGSKDSIDGRAENTFTFEGFKSSTVADIPTGTTKVCILRYGLLTYIGSASFQGLDVDGDIATGVAKVSYQGKFHGAVSASI